jgi:hypothetical protein
MKAMKPWITYRTRFLVKAKQLNSNLTFTDFLGRPHSGRKGDYLVESGDGVLSITPRQIFEDVYVPLLVTQQDAAHPDSNAGVTTAPIRKLPRRAVARHVVAKGEAANAFSLPNPFLPNRFLANGVRKSPQPYRDGRNQNSSLGSI